MTTLPPTPQSQESCKKHQFPICVRKNQIRFEVEVSMVKLRSQFNFPVDFLKLISCENYSTIIPAGGCRQKRTFTWNLNAFDTFYSPFIRFPRYRAVVCMIRLYNTSDPIHCERCTIGLAGEGVTTNKVWQFTGVLRVTDWKTATLNPASSAKIFPWIFVCHLEARTTIGNISAIFFLKIFHFLCRTRVSEQIFIFALPLLCSMR